MKPDFSSAILQNLTDAEKIKIYKEVIEYQKTQRIDKNSLLYKKAEELNRETFKDTMQEEITRVELYVGLSLAKKYIKENNL